MDKDVVLVYGRSTAVEAGLLRAHQVSVPQCPASAPSAQFTPISCDFFQPFAFLALAPALAWAAMPRACMCRGMCRGATFPAQAAGRRVCGARDPSGDDDDGDDGGRGSQEGTSLRVIIVDSRPRLEGKKMLESLSRAGISCTYIMINSLSYVMKEVCTPRALLPVVCACLAVCVHVQARAE